LNVGVDPKHLVGGKELHAMQKKEQVGTSEGKKENKFYSTVLAVI
jgi:hypothetical protein